MNKLLRQTIPNGGASATVAALKGEEYETERNIRPKTPDAYLMYSFIAMAFVAILMAAIALRSLPSNGDISSLRKDRFGYRYRLNPHAVGGTASCYQTNISCR